jgi:YebC/PmpR family DNA-binding regulatory protein
MSGHSKWSTIKRQKEATDIKRGKVFSKLAKAITLAAREGADPEINFKLRLLIDKAKHSNMPKNNIDRAIAKASGGAGGDQLSEVVYEGFGPEGIAIIVEVVTDNRNRTRAEIKNLFEKGGGRLGSPGSVAYQFKPMGLVTVEKTDQPDEQILKIIDLGVEEVEETTDALEVYVQPQALVEIRKKLIENNFKILGAELIKQPKNEIQISDPGKVKKVLKFMNNLQGCEDVQRVFANFDIPEEMLK